ncbi:ATP-binding protein [Colwellia hornerae]|uniref:histidine kinase n=1 Tax=Colwellia hornerae TaxID=89402 RepID=A0A5C6Q2U3_9GAMM|nr:ATP-binding protein [Colwellia hornerae]TWX52572.1 PAS domain S-box protein [Colwellia hornerae]TWX58335.1 PAS domain S-box protein [Colwellia hornerae]TWX63151.1 PAS domain S-box protein [Colwellia hornerae]
MKFSPLLSHPAVKPFSLLIVFALSVTMCGLLIFQYQKNIILERSEDNLASIANLKVERIDYWLDGLERDALIMSEDYYLTYMLESWQRGGAPYDINRHNILHRLKAIQDSNKYAALTLLDLNGLVILSTNPNIINQPDESIQQQVMDVIQSKQMILGEINLGQKKKLKMAMLVPLFFESQEGRQIIGVLYFRIHPEQFLFPMLDAWPVGRLSAETLLVRRDGGEALYLNEVLRKKDLSLSMSIPLNQEDIPGTNAVNGKTGFFYGVDYQNVPVISYLAQIPRMDWGMVAKVDEDEVYAPIYRRARQLLWMGGILFSVVSLATWLYVRRTSAVELARLKADKELKKSEESLRLLVTSVRDYAIIMLEPDGRISSWNKGAEYITGYAFVDVFGQFFSCLYPHDEITAGQPQKELNVARELGRFEINGWQIRKNGTRFWANTVITAIHATNNKVIGFAQVMRDISEQRQTEQLRAESEALRHASQMKSEFLASMSHELRTPLNAIIGFSEVLRDGLVGDLSEQQSKYIGNIFESGQHLLSLINDVLDLSKVEAGKMILDIETFQLASLLHDCTSMVKEKALSREIELIVDVQEDLGFMQCDGRKLKQIIYNLLSNAVKFTPQGGKIKLSGCRVVRADAIMNTENNSWKTRLITDADSIQGTFDEFLEITVNDTGIGISDTDLNKLFQPFTQIDSSLSRKYGGTGLGLVMVKALAGLHGGFMAVSSAEDKGSCFKVWLPWRDISTKDVSVSAKPLAIINDQCMASTLVEEHDLSGAITVEKTL